MGAQAPEPDLAGHRPQKHLLRVRRGTWQVLMRNELTQRKGSRSSTQVTTLKGGLCSEQKESQDVEPRSPVY